MNTLLPGGRPQMVSLTPFRKLLLRTDSANQLVVVRLVEYLRIHAPTVRAGRTQHDIATYGQAKDVNRRGRRWRRGYGDYLGTKTMDGANVGIVRSDVRNGVGNGALSDVVVLHPRTIDEKRMVCTRVDRESVCPAANQSDGGVGLVSVYGIKEAR